MTGKGERGQAIVLIALIFAVLCGMLALAVDGGRGFVARRSIQNSADASADAGAMAYARNLSFGTAETAQVQAYMDNRAIGGTFQCTPGIPQVPDAGQTVAMHCTFQSDPTQDVAIAVSDRPCPVCVEQFWTGGQEQLSTAFIQVLGAAPTFPVAAQGVAWWAQGAYPSGPYGYGQPPGSSDYGNPPSGWTGPWPPSGSTPSGGPGGGATPSPVPTGGGGGGCVSNCGSCSGGTCPPPNGGAIPPVVLALSGACGGSGDALTLNGSSSAAAVIGNVVSYGDVVGTVTTGGGTTVPVAADTTAYCQAPTGVAGWCYPSGQPPGTAGCTGGSVFQYGKPAPPGYRLQPVNTSLPTGTPGLTVNLEPGVFPLPALLGGASNHSCSFLAAGVYQFQANMSLTGGVLSNELRPPDEPAWGQSNPTTTVQGSPYAQFWDQNGANCAGHFGLSPVLDVAGPGLPPPADGVPLATGLYAVRVTSVRQDNGFTRESPPSICRTLNVATPSALEVSISNVPGALAYNVYLSTVSINTALSSVGLGAGTPGGTCAGPFYRLGQIAVTNPTVETNADTSGCPSLTQTSACSLGVTVGAFDQTQLNQVLNDVTSGTVPPSPALPPTPCLAAIASNCLKLTSLVAEFRAPAGAGLADQDPPIDSPGTSNSPNWTSDYANWGLCAYPGQNLPANCENTQSGYNPADYDTPGAVQLQENINSACFDFSSGTSTAPSGGLTYLFSGYQYAWALALQPASNGSCSDYFDGSSGSELIGHVDVPQAAAHVAGNNSYLPAVYGTFTANQVNINSASGVAVYFVPPPLNSAGYGTAVP